jgi:hypothetical protein
LAIMRGLQKAWQRWKGSMWNCTASIKWCGNQKCPYKIFTVLYSKLRTQGIQRYQVCSKNRQAATAAERQINLIYWLYFPHNIPHSALFCQCKVTMSGKTHTKIKLKMYHSNNLHNIILKPCTKL